MKRTSSDDFSQNFRYETENDLPINEGNFQKFIDEHGMEQAIGYIRAVRDFIHELEYAAYDCRPHVGDGDKPLTRVKNNVDKLLLHKENFLKFVLESEHLPKASISGFEKALQS